MEAVSTRDLELVGTCATTTLAAAPLFAEQSLWKIYQPTPIFSPWKLVLGTQDGDSSKVLSQDKCTILQQYAQEVQKGKASFWFHYLAMDDSLAASIPMVWSSAVVAELQGLPPGDKLDSSLLDWFSTSCHADVLFENLDQASRQSLLAAVTRSASSMRFLPLFDLLNHHNGLVNVESSASQDGNTVKTTRSIQKGQEIFISYRAGGGSEATSSEIFRRYGFVEDWPQHWTWISSSSGGSEHGDDEKENGQQRRQHIHEERFLVFPNGFVILYPTEEMLLERIPPQGDGPVVHNDSLTSAQLMQFYEAGKRLLKSMATSVQDDVLLLSERELALASSLTSSAFFDSQQDLMHARHLVDATRYRLEFKKAIEMGIRTAKSCLENRQQGLQEL
jgi:SET domain